MSSSRSKIINGYGKNVVFFDMEYAGATNEIVEFGALKVCPETFSVMGTSWMFLQPNANVLSAFKEQNGITLKHLAGAGKFSDDYHKTIYAILDGKTWIGDNITGLHIPRLMKAYQDIGKVPPRPNDALDLSDLLKHYVELGVQDMSLQSLARHFGLGEQQNRSLEDCRLTLDVLIRCGAVLTMREYLKEEQDKKEK